MNLLGAKLYDPAGAVSKATSSLLAMTAFDTTNLRLAITVPAHGMVRFKLQCTIEGATTFPQILLGVLNGATVVGRVTPLGAVDGTALATTRCTQTVEFTATGLTPGSTNFDAAYGVEIAVAATNIKYGGPNDTTTDNAWGAFVFEAFDPQPQTTTGQLSVDANGRVDVSKWVGTTIPAPAIAGVPKVDVNRWNGSVPASLNADASLPAHDQPIFSGSVVGAGTTTTATLDSSLSGGATAYNGMVLAITCNSPTALVYYQRAITNWNGGTNVITFSPALPAAPDAANGDKWEIRPNPVADVGYWLTKLPNDLVSGRVDANTQATAATLTFNLTGNVTGTLSGTVGGVAATGINNASFATDTYVYHARIELTRNTPTTTDEWTVTWFQNGVPVVAGITVPTIQVIKRSDGSDLIATIGMVQIGTSGSYKYDEGVNRITPGQAYVARAVATIGGLSRSWEDIITRDV